MKRFTYFLLAIIVISCNNDDGTTTFRISINSGGQALTFQNTNWLADQDNSATRKFENIVEIDGTDNDVVYQTEVFDSPGLIYEIAVPGNGPWLVDLHFAEIFHGIENANGPGARVFNVDIEGGQGQLTDFDIMVEAGGTGIAIVESFPGIIVADSSLTITFSSVAGDVKISGVEIRGSF